jgi:hypothetical protein
MSPNYCGSACFRVGFDKAPYNLYFDINKAHGSKRLGAPGIAAAAVPVSRDLGHCPVAVPHRPVCS